MRVEIPAPIKKAIRALGFSIAFATCLRLMFRVFVRGFRGGKISEYIRFFGGGNG